LKEVEKDAIISEKVIDYNNVNNEQIKEAEKKMNLQQKFISKPMVIPPYKGRQNFPRVVGSRIEKGHFDVLLLEGKVNRLKSEEKEEEEAEEERKCKKNVTEEVRKKSGLEFEKREGKAICLDVEKAVVVEGLSGKKISENEECKGLIIGKEEKKDVELIANIHKDFCSNERLKKQETKEENLEILKSLKVIDFEKHISKNNDLLRPKNVKELSENIVEKTMGCLVKKDNDHDCNNTPSIKVSNVRDETEKEEINTHEAKERPGQALKIFPWKIIEKSPEK
jgi:hypothetical protein